MRRWLRHRRFSQSRFVMRDARARRVGAARRSRRPRRRSQPLPRVPILVVETAKGTIEIQTFPADAPKTVEHIVALAKRNFYNGQRVHRVVPGFVVQFGDPQTRDMTKRDRWGSGGSGRSIGVVGGETEARRRRRGCGASGRSAPGDSQMYITFAAQPKLDRDFTVFGQVSLGMDVAQKARGQRHHSASNREVSPNSRRPTPN